MDPPGEIKPRRRRRQSLWLRPGSGKDARSRVPAPAPSFPRRVPSQRGPGQRALDPAPSGAAQLATAGTGRPPRAPGPDTGVGLHGGSGVGASRWCLFTRWRRRLGPGSWAVAVALPCAVTLGPLGCCRFGAGESVLVFVGVPGRRNGGRGGGETRALVSSPSPHSFGPTWCPHASARSPPSRLAPLGLPRVLHGLQDGAGAWALGPDHREGGKGAPNLDPTKLKGPIFLLWTEQTPTSLPSCLPLPRGGGPGYSGPLIWPPPSRWSLGPASLWCQPGRERGRWRVPVPA